MANTVNDVMNVIASPDYGIKNIAGTNQEILAILQGTHNSKNNIHAIVDDVRSLLQKLVSVATEKKPIEIGDKSQKINPKNIQDILDETKNIRKSIDNLTKTILKQSVKGSPAIAKLSDKASQKVADAMVKNMQNQSKGGGMSALVDAFNKLKDISLKDIIIGNKKLKLITKIFDKAKKDLKINDKDFKSIVKLINASPEIINSLSKISKNVNKIIKDNIIGKLSFILIGKDSILSLSGVLRKNEKFFDKANKITITIKELTISLNTIMRKLLFTSLLAKMISDKDIDKIETSLNRIIEISKTIIQNKKSIDTAAKTKSLKEFAAILNKTMMKLFFAAIWSKNISDKNIDTIELSICKIIDISKILVKNKKDIDTAAKTKTLKEFAAILNKTMMKLFFTSLWAKNISDKNINTIELSIYKLIDISKILVKNKKDIESGIKPAKLVGELSSALNKSMRKLFFASLWAKMISNKGIDNIGTTLNKIFTVSKKLIKNKKDIESGTKVAKKVTTLSGNLLVTSIYLTIAAVTAIPALLGAKLLSKMVNTIIPIAKKLSKNNKHITNAAGSAIILTAFTGLMAVSSLFLATIAVTGIPALLGAKLLDWTIDIIVPIAKKLSRNNKHIAKAVGSAIILTAFSGLMAITSLILASIAKRGPEALLGSIFTLGFVAVNVITFAILSKASSFIIKGAIVMAIMSISLLIYGVALGKVADATKDMSWKQLGMLGTFTVGLGLSLAILGIPAVSPFILMGSVVMAAMGASLLIYGIALGKVADATKDMSWKQLGMLGTITVGLGLSLAALGVPIVAPFVLLGAGVLTAMGLSLNIFASSLKIISDMGEVPTKTLNQTLNAMKLLKNFFEKNSLSLKAVKAAKRYKKMMKPFGNTIKHLVKLKKLGSVPLKLVHQTLNAMKVIAVFYEENQISKKTIKQAKRYKKMMKPFGNTIKHLVKLKKLGSVPLKLVQQTLNAMKVIGNYYTDNPISSKTIKQAKRYKKMMKPFGKTIKYFFKLKELGSIPLKLVHQTLNAMSAIANYYEENPISRKAIKQAKRYKKMMKPFGKTLKYFVKLKEMGGIPMKLIYQTLNGMTAIANYYENNEISKNAIKQAHRYKQMLKPFGYTIENLAKLKDMGNIPLGLIHQALNAISVISEFYLKRDVDFAGGIKASLGATLITNMVSGFGKAVKYFKELKDLQTVPTKAIESIVIAMGDICKFYDNVKFSNFIELKTKFSEIIVDKFTTMAKKIQDKFTNIKEINHAAVTSIVNACNSIIDFYSYRIFYASENKVQEINSIVEKFSNTAKLVKDKIQGYDKTDFTSVKYAVKSMKKIIKFLKYNTLNSRQQKRATQNISLLKGMASAMSNLIKINPSSLSSIGDALSNALGGVNTVDLGQVQAVTNMFNAFNGINKSENIINKFTESVKEFTTTCKNLMDAMNYNTDAINNMDTSGTNNSTPYAIRENNIIEIGTDNTTKKNNGVCITNVDEIARTIAEKINGVLSVDVPDTQVQLLINGTGGNEWTISRY